MYTLKKLEPPFGTRAAPIFEPAYAEEAKVVGGVCRVRLPETRDYLLKMGYEEVAPSPRARRRKRRR